MLSYYLALLDDPRLDLAFTDFYEKNVSLALRLAMNKLGGNMEDAEDAVHDAFEDLAKNFSEFMKKPEKDRAPYFAAIVKNKAVNLIRKRKRLVDLEEVPEMADEETPDKLLIDNENFGRLAELILKLPPKDREVLERCCIMNESAEEVAEILGVKVGAVYTRLSRAKKRLDKELQKEGIYL